MLFFSLFSLLLFITAAQGEAFQGLTHLSVSPPQPQCPCATGWHWGPPPLPAFAWMDRGVGPGCGRDGQRGTGGCSTRGGCMHGRESAVRRAATCNPRKPGWGFVLQSGSSWCRWGSFPPCCQPGEVLGGRRCWVPGARGQSIFTCAIRWTSVCSPAETLLQCHGSWAPGNCGLNARERR